MITVRHQVFRLIAVIGLAGLILYPTAVEAGAGPMLSVSPTTASPGDLITWNATGFEGCGVVTVVLIPGGTNVGGIVGGSGSNSFAAPAEPGSYGLNAAGGGCTAAATFEVVAPTTTPPTTAAPTTTEPAATTSTEPGTTVAGATTVPAATTTTVARTSSAPAAGTAPVTPKQIPVTG
jgi:hypothetical protein